MNSRVTPTWIDPLKIADLVQLEPTLVVLGLLLGSLLIWKLLLRGMTGNRHKIIWGYFRNISGHAILWLALFATYFLIHKSFEDSLMPPALARMHTYLGLFSLLMQAVVFVKTARILIFEYLFFSNMNVGVPVLLGNLFTFVLSLGIAGWMATEVFGVKLAPLLASSAIFSIVLGLALQDTLGNLFAGIAMQFDKPYQLGDWVEIQSGPQKWAGQVHEITWRATLLIGMADELITLPNRVIASSQVSNYSGPDRPFARVQLVRVPYSVPIELVKTTLLGALDGIEEVRRDVPPMILVAEAHESWVLYKVVYLITAYGRQNIIGDQVLERCLNALETASIPVAPPRMEITRCDSAASA